LEEEEEEDALIYECIKMGVSWVFESEGIAIT
jgi:hypothetical protein